MSNCSCCACSHYKTQSISVVGSNLVLDLGSTPTGTLKNGQILNFTVCQSIPTLSSPIQIAFEINGVTYVAITNGGNRVYSDQIRKCMTYTMRFATDTLCPVVSCCGLKKTSHAFPVITPPTEPTPESE